MFSNLSKFVSTIIMLTFFLTSCATQQLTYTSFSKIKEGMTEEEVINILGEPTNVTGGSVGAGAIGAVFGLDNLSGTTMTWTTKDVKANIVFFQGKVKTKGFTNQF